MKRFHLALIGLTGLAVFPLFLQAQQGASSPYPFLPQQSQHPLLKSKGIFGEENFTVSGTRKRQRAKILDEPEANQDILVTKDVGEWMVLVHSYSDEKNKDVWARQMVSVLRRDYRLHAYVYNYGRKERIAEELRIEREIENYRRQVRELKKQPGANVVEKKTYRIRRIPIKEDVGVMIGGYKDMKTARLALKQIRDMKPLDPKKVRLDKAFIAKRDKQTGQSVESWVVVNPFSRSFVVRNPTWPKKSKRQAPFDIAVLKRMNSNNPFNLLKNRGKITLAVKEFRTPAAVEQNAGPQKTQGLGLGFGIGVTRIDGAAQSALNLAKSLRRVRFDTYVLHTKHSSVVTVGSFQTVDDPQLRLTQQRWQQFTKLHWQIQLFSTAWPMKVPR